jgi:hypothetical protein
LERSFALGTGKHKSRILAKASRKATEVVYSMSYIVYRERNRIQETEPESRSYSLSPRRERVRVRGK